MSLNGTNGIDGSDVVTVSISVDGGTTYSSEITIAGSAANQRWDFTATGSVTITYDGDNSPTAFTSSNGASGISTVRIDIPNANSQVRVRIVLLNNDANERWVIDDVRIRGTASSTTKYWDVTAGTGNGVGGTGTWGTTFSNTAAGDATLSTAAAADNIIYEGTAGTVTIDADRSAASHTFNTNNYGLATSGAHTLSGPITLGGYNLNLASATGNTLTLPGIISGTGGSLTHTGAGTTELSGANTYTGNTTINAGTLSIGADNNLGAGSISLSGGTLRTTASFTTAKALAITAASTLQVNTGTLTYSGTATSGTGNLTKAGAGILVMPTGQNYTGKTLVTAGTWSTSGESAFGTNPASFTNDQISFSGGCTLLATGNIAFNSNRGITLGTGGVQFNSNGNIITAANIITGAGSINKIGTGTLRYDVNGGTHTYTGTTTITGGTLQLERDNDIPDASNMILAGGTLQTGRSSDGAGSAETVGTLQLTANSTIALGTGSHTLSFANSSAVSWTAGQTLTITGWAGTPGASGTAGRLFIGTTTGHATTAQLAQIQFTGYALGAVMQLATGEVVPTPTITTTNTAYGPFCNTTGNNISVAFTTVGSFTGNFFVQISDASGVFPANSTSNIISIGATTSPITATIPAGQAAGTGYRVRVVNTTPTAQSSNNNGSNITINGNITITTQPTNQTVTSPGTATFTVVASGTIGSYQWQVNTGSGWSNVVNGTPYSGATTATLIINPSNVGQDGYLYRVLVNGSSPCGSVTSSVAELNVQPGPCVTETFTNMPANNSSYTDRTWTGDDGGTWNTTLARTDQSISSSRAICIRRNGTITSPNISGGMASLSFTTLFPFSETVGNLEVRVNGNLVRTVLFSEMNGTTPVNFTVSNLNIAGTVQVQFTSTASSGSDSRFAIDNVSWICYSGCTPTHTISGFTPSDGPAGTWVTISGTGFTGSPTVKFGGINATSVTLVNSTTLKAKVPSGAITGAVTVGVGSCNLNSSSSFTVLTSNANCGSGATGTSGLVISEVFDSKVGSLSYIELFNPTTSAISLTNYSLRIVTDGPTNTDYTLGSASIAAGGVYIIS
ncbi:MAG TPA: autotransporter-associated beta strand repeat-containing protein, partial [Phnomibacter sp.]|nr:autotransporter-associated beta strand repeat-containing protein [Phnomibacter sp.]